MGVEFGMYQTVLRDYMGSDMSSGGKTVTTRMSVVDEIAQLGIDQQRRLQLKDWELIENNFYQKRSEWLQNMEYLRDTGLKRFDRITTEFMNDRYAWRLDFDKRAEAGEKKYTDAIKETIEAQKQWAVDFAEAAQNPSKRATLNDLYNRIQTMITEVNSGLPNGISSGVNANDILSKYHNRLPDSIDRRWIESAGNVNTDFFLTRISNKELNAKDLMKDYEKLQDEMSDRLAILAKIQALHNLQLYDDQFGEIIQNANEGLQKQLDQEMGMEGFFRAGDKYVKMGQSGMPHIIRNYNFFNYEPIPIPQVRDSNGKEWDMTNLDALLGEDGPSANDLAIMAELAMNSMEYKFKEVYNPEKPETYETPSDYSRFRQAVAGSSFLSGQSQGMELDITKYYLVGEVVGGTFGKHHHDEFFDIISQKEKLAFLDQVVVNEQERKAKKRAAREGMWETVGTVVAVVGLSILTGGIAGGLAAHGLAAMGLGGGAILGIAGAAVGGYVAYQGHKGYQMGGEKGAALAMGSSALAMFSGSPVSFGGSYSYEQGFGINLGYSFGGSGNSSLGNVGLGYSEKGGFGLSGGINITPSIGINANIHQSGAWGVGASYNQLNNAGQKQGMAMNVGYRETADGKVGLTGGVSYYNTSGDQSTYGIGANYDSLFGWGASISHSGTSNNGGPVKSFNGQASWNQNSGFQSQLDMKFDRVKMLELLGESWDYLTDVAQGFTDSMVNAWDDVVSGAGYIFGGRDREGGSLMNDLFGHSDEHKMKKYWESLTSEERIRLLTSNFAPVNGRGGGDEPRGRQVAGGGSRFPEEYYGADNWLETSNDKYKNDRYDEMFENYEGLERIRHRIKNSSGGNETYYAALPSELRDDILQDIIIDGAAGLRRTVVFQPDPDNPDRILVYRSYMNSDGDWVVGSTWDIVQNETGTWRIHNQETENGSYNWVRINPDNSSKKNNHPLYPEPMVHLGYYVNSDNPYNDAPFESVTPLKRIEVYGYISNKWYGSIRYNPDTRMLTPYPDSKIPSNHSNRTWRQIDQENLGGAGPFKGFHEIMRKNPDGSFNTSPRPWRRP